MNYSPIDCDFEQEYVERKRKRTNLSEEQTLMLEEAFDKSAYLTGDLKITLCRRTGMTPQKIAKWFDNRRSKERNKSRPLSPSLSKTSASSRVSTPQAMSTSRQESFLKTNFHPHNNNMSTSVVSAPLSSDSAKYSTSSISISYVPNSYPLQGDSELFAVQKSGEVILSHTSPYADNRYQHLYPSPATSYHDFNDTLRTHNPTPLLPSNSIPSAMTYPISSAIPAYNLMATSGCDPSAHQLQSPLAIPTFSAVLEQLKCRLPRSNVPTDSTRRIFSKDFNDNVFQACVQCIDVGHPPFVQFAADAAQTFLCHLLHFLLEEFGVALTHASKLSRISVESISNILKTEHCLTKGRLPQLQQLKAKEYRMIETFKECLAQLLEVDEDVQVQAKGQNELCFYGIDTYWMSDSFLKWLWVYVEATHHRPPESDLSSVSSDSKHRLMKTLRSSAGEEEEVEIADPTYSKPSYKWQLLVNQLSNVVNTCLRAEEECLIPIVCVEGNLWSFTVQFLQAWWNQEHESFLKDHTPQRLRLKNSPDTCFSIQIGSILRLLSFV